jgi:methylthioribose-1-phosphate isomerase
MKVDGEAYRTIWPAEDGWSVRVIDQTLLPHAFEVVTLKTLADGANAIRSMVVRGAPLIGVTAAYALCLAMREEASDAALDRAVRLLLATRPTAVNLRTLLSRMQRELAPLPERERPSAAYRAAAVLADEDVSINRAIGEHGLALIQDAARLRGAEPVRILTHCNAGWLATVDWGTALAPVYRAHDAGIALHVWVDETRPRNQGASLTAWELGKHGVPHTLIVDNAGGHLMQHGLVDLCLMGTDRVTATGDVANKVGTYLKALAAHDNGVPFYIGAPSPSIDWTLRGPRSVPIEERAAQEVTEIQGRLPDGTLASVRIAPVGISVKNIGFDVTPARLVTRLITERGACAATEEDLQRLFPEF